MSEIKEIFVVVQVGVYRHDVGPFAFDLDKTIELAKARQLLEKDDYHEFEILRLRSDSLEDGDRVAVVKGLVQPAAPCAANHWKRYELTGEQSVERLAIARGKKS